MNRVRTLLAVFVVLTLALAPVAGFAMTNACQGMQQTMTDDITDSASMADHGSMANCPCHNAMPDCGAMTACQTSSGCASQCMPSCGVVSMPLAPSTPDQAVAMFTALALGHSLSIQPPAPPPRA